MPDAELLVFRALKRPPWQGELYADVDKCDVGVYVRLSGADADYVGARAVVPVEDYLSGAVERVMAAVDKRRVETGGFATATRDAIRAALMPPPPEPDVPEWMVECARSWSAPSGTGTKHFVGGDVFTDHLARHIADHHRRAGE